MMSATSKLKAQLTATASPRRLGRDQVTMVFLTSRLLRPCCQNCEPDEVARPGRPFPHDLEVRPDSRGIDEIDGPLADDLIGDVYVAVDGVADRPVHERRLQRFCPIWKTTLSQRGMRSVSRFVLEAA